MPRGLGVRDEDVGSARSPVPMQVAAAMFTPASLIAAATCASAPGVLSMSMTRSNAMVPRGVSLSEREVYWFAAARAPR